MPSLWYVVMAAQASTHMGWGGCSGIPTYPLVLTFTPTPPLAQCGAVGLLLNVPDPDVSHPTTVWGPVLLGGEIEANVRCWAQWHCITLITESCRVLVSSSV